MKKIAILSLAFALAFAFSVTPAFASLTFVSSSNSAFVGNYVSSHADTGDNYAGGSQGGDGGNAGDIDNNDDGDVEDSTTGNGGAGGDAGIGGTVVTGNATAGAAAVNDVNSNRTSIDNCGCENRGHSLTIVNNRNRAIVLNGVEAKADTGDNAAKGSEGGEGGNGGDIENGDYRSDGDVDNSDTGNGGAGGNGSDGGYVETGTAVSEAAAVNVVNRNVTRIR